VIEAVNSTKPDGSYMGHLVANIRSTLLAIPCWTMGYVPREVNKVAHVLARLVTTENMIRVWLRAYLRLHLRNRVFKSKIAF
jgi:hypothetical protein